jgi:hypothetical protein
MANWKGRRQAGLFIAWTTASGVLENRGKNILRRPEPKRDRQY